MIIEIKDTNGKSVGMFIANPKDFKTGSKGFFGSTKLEIEGVRYQVQFQAVAIGSKASIDNPK